MNISNIVSSLKYIRTNAEIISGLSKWIYDDLQKYNCDHSKIAIAFDNNDLEVLELLSELITDKTILITTLLYYFDHKTKRYEDDYKLVRLTKLILKHNGMFTINSGHHRYLAIKVFPKTYLLWMTSDRIVFTDHSTIEYHLNTPLLDTEYDNILNYGLH